jgi:biotin carboxyl carrier protein
LTTEILAVMTGQVTKVHVKEGDKVENGQVVATINIMKMDYDITSESSGVVKDVLVKEGSVLKVDDVIMRLITD